MNKADYKKAISEAGFEFRDWLSVLPTGAKLTNPVPLVVVKVDQRPPPGFIFRWSTFFFVEGYHRPIGTRIVALVHHKNV